MKLTRAVLCVAASLALAGAGHAQSGDEIIKRHVKAAGGDKKLKSITSVRYAGTVSLNGGVAKPFTWFERRPDRFYIEMQTERGAQIDSYNGRSGWREDPGAGLRTVTGREQARARAPMRSSLTTVSKLTRKRSPRQALPDKTPSTAARCTSLK
ncbi:MAG: hypothetical protein HY046_10680 [Acidobacteria bacterium]|nr:hypothetical protein [Acidobacteriota bacterium]